MLDPARSPMHPLTQQFGELLRQRYARNVRGTTLVTTIIMRMRCSTGICRRARPQTAKPYRVMASRRHGPPSPLHCTNNAALRAYRWRSAQSHSSRRRVAAVRAANRQQLG